VSSNGVKVYKKGDILFKEGDRATHIWLVQAGSVALQLIRNTEKGKPLPIEFASVGKSQVVGELALVGVATYPYTAVIMADTTLLELPVETVKTQIEALPQLGKILTKSLADRLKLFTNELKSFKLDRDQSPCPPDQVSKIFGAVYAAVIWKGEKLADGWTITWPSLKSYAQRVFGLSPKKTETVCNILVKIGDAKYIIGKNEEDGTEEIQHVKLSRVEALDNFVDFYQYYYFKGGKAELFKFDERLMSIASHFVKQGEAAELDRAGIARLDYTKLMDSLSLETGIKLNSDHFNLFEQKGVYFKRHSTETEVQLHFELAELRKMVSHWGFFREIEKWNERGSIDPNEPVVAEKPKNPGESNCPDCKTPYLGQPKFCSNCGCKFTAVAA
jgi:hypothetical protein